MTSNFRSLIVNADMMFYCFLFMAFLPSVPLIASSPVTV
jgi:hypothetical protein